jgi:hypothetical protein
VYVPVCRCTYSIIIVVVSGHHHLARSLVSHDRIVSRVSFPQEIVDTKYVIVGAVVVVVCTRAGKL